MWDVRLPPDAEAEAMRFLNTGKRKALAGERFVRCLETSRIIDRWRGQLAGLPGYTVGQRKGIGVAWRVPLYVAELRPEANELVVAEEGETLVRRRFRAREVVWLSPPAGTVRARVQIRYRSRAEPGLVRPSPNGDVEVALDRPARAVAPGQCAVFYDAQRDSRVLGGGWIAA